MYAKPFDGPPQADRRTALRVLGGLRGFLTIPRTPAFSSNALECSRPPRPGDREGDARALNVPEQPFAVRAVARARELGAAEVADYPVALAVQDDVVFGKLENLAVDREAVHEFLAAAVLAEHEPAARADRDVVR